MATKNEIEGFLSLFKNKLDIFDVIFLNRDKNLQALIDLEITRVSRTEILKSLGIDNYFRGPTKDFNNGPDLWEFGTICKQKEVYIKITMGIMSKPVICISFHLAERVIDYPFKKL
jgi:hypothetical protein